MGWYQRRSTWGLNIQSSYSSVMLVLLLLPCLLPLAWCAHGYGHPPAPELLCRDTNTSIYAEVCVPAFAEQVTPVTLAAKEVVDADYCFDRVLTICEETNTVVQREICTYVYEREDVTAPCTTTQVTYEEKSETMKVTTCSPVEKGYGGGYGYQHANQHCREEYQTQAYKVPLVTAPWRYLAALLIPLPRRSVSPRTSPSLRSSVRTRWKTSASTLLSSLMPPTLLIKRRSLSETQAVRKSP